MFLDQYKRTIPDQKVRNFSREGQCTSPDFFPLGRDPQIHSHPLSPAVPRYSRLRRSTCALIHPWSSPAFVSDHRRYSNKTPQAPLAGHDELMKKIHAEVEVAYTGRVTEKFLTWTCARPSVCLSSVTFVRPTQTIEIFGNVCTPFGTFGHLWSFGENFTEIVPGKPLRRGG